eukprot:Nitzschia sp. Nitz4//scaffold210_size37948//19937//20902//NITZ4_007690-RA/size37948-processed-gene-0.50-mRNA-1//-1//CDS//3329541930//6502//frame0
MGEDDVFHLRIKSFKDVEISVPAGSVVAHVKQQVRAALGVKEEDRYLRLICKGRLLLPDDHPIQDFNVQNGDVVHAVLAPASKGVSESSPNGGVSDTGGGASSRRRRRNGTVVGPGGRVTRVAASTAGDGDSDASSDEELGIRERRGFDGLRDGGLTRSEISAIRSYFSRQVDRYVEQNPDGHSDEPDALRRRLLMEEDWMAAQGPTSEFRLNLNQNTLVRIAPFHRDSRAGENWVASRSASIGTDWDLMWGFLWGYLFGSIILLFVWRPNVSHKQKIGILAGISFGLALEVFSDGSGTEDSAGGVAAVGGTQKDDDDDDY